MAIAGILLMVAPGQREETLRAAQENQDIAEVQDAGSGSLACVLEALSLRLQKALEEAAALPGVLQLDVTYINYEDDLDRDGHMPCPAIRTMCRHARREQP